MSYLLRTTSLFLLIMLALAGCNREWVRTVRQVSSPEQEPQIQDGELGQTVQLAAGKHYDRSRFHRFWWGANYRDEWTTPVEVPIFNPQAEGYTLVKQGGGRQTINMRLADEDGNEYVLRSIDKDPAVNLSPFFQKVLVGPVVKDQNANAHPYAPLTLPPMAEALGIYHTNPQLRYIPFEADLGKHHETFAGMMAILEHRPAGDQSQFEYLGASEKVVSTKKMLEAMLRQNTSRVDARHYLKNRLFDMLLGDWSRHEDNWRWASYKKGNGRVYKAIPRDRDHVYYYLDGAIPRFLRFFGVKKHFRSFGPSFDNLVAMNHSAAQLDEMLLASLSREDWQAIADSVKLALNDAAIEAGVGRLPQASYNIRGPWLEECLKSRRDQLPREVMKYYEHLARNPQLYGSDKHEKFVLRADGDKLQVEIWKTKKGGKEQQKLFSRTYLPSETKEITLLGLAGNDRFVFRGESRSPIRVKVYGGADEDSYLQESKQPPAAITIYDLGKGSTFKLQKGIKVKTLKKPRIEEFDANGRLLHFYIWD